MSIESFWAETKDWIAKLGLGSMVGWFANNLWRSYQKRIDRGRKLVDEDRPELVPLGWTTGSSFAIGRVRLKNQGDGIAQDISLALTGCKRVARDSKIQPGEEGVTAELDFEDQPFTLEEQPTTCYFTIHYSDKFGNDYVLTIPASQDKRDDGKFNLNAEWNNYRTNEPTISNRSLWKIGRY